MIQDEEDLQYVREQLGRVQRALDDLEQSVRPRSVERFEMMAESYRDQIAELAQQIAEYESRPATVAH